MLLQSKKVFLTTLIIFIACFETFSQDTEELKDDPAARRAFELMQTKDPNTGMLPNNIAQREFDFMQHQDIVHQYFSRYRATPSMSGATWEHRGPYHIGGRTRALAVDVTDENIILAGGVSGGLWRSTDLGDSWIKVTSPRVLQSITCIAQDTRTGHTDTWYYGTGEFRGNSAGGGGGAFLLGDGLFKSTDGGLTWNLLENTDDGGPELYSDHFQLIDEIAVNPVNGNLLVSAREFLYQSKDGGATFDTVFSTNGNLGWLDVTVSSTGIIYLAVENHAIYESDDDGVTWTDITQNRLDDDLDVVASDTRVEIALAPSNENILYAINVNGRIWKYDKSDDPDLNGVGSWRLLREEGPYFGNSPQAGIFDSQTGYNLLIKVSPNDENIVVFGGTNLYLTTDGFVSDSNLSWIGGYKPLPGYHLYNNHHPDQHAFVFLSGTKALSGNDGGIQLTQDFTNVRSSNADNESVVWESKNNGYLTTQSYAVSVGSADGIMSGFQDNSTWLTTSTDAKATWTTQLFGDGGYSAFNSDGLYRWVSAQWGNIYRQKYTSKDSHEATESVYLGRHARRGLFIVPFYVDPRDDDILYVAGQRGKLAVYTNALADDFNDFYIAIDLPSIATTTQIGVSYGDYVYIGNESGNLFKVNTVGIKEAGYIPQVENITGDMFPPNAYASGIASNSTNDQEVMVCFSNYSVLSIFHSLDGGSTWEQVAGNLEEDISGSGSGPSTRSVAIASTDPPTYLVGTSTGLYSTNLLDAENTVWTQESEDEIGNVVVQHIALHKDGRAAIGTHGNGIYSAKFNVSTIENDLAVVDIGVNSNKPSSSKIIKTYIKNLGRNDQNNFQLSLYVDGRLLVTDNINSTLSYTDVSNYEHEFSVGADMSEERRIFNIKVVMNLMGDEDHTNNEYVKEVKTRKTVTTYPYVEDFEIENLDWSANSLWERGIIDGDYVTSASNSTNVWMTDLDDNYGNNINNATLATPFFNLSDLANPTIVFSFNMSTESGVDGLRIGYRLSELDDFILLNENHFPDSTNWFWTDITGRRPWRDTSGDFPFNAWTGHTRRTFTRVEASLDSLKREEDIQLGFIFQSDQSSTYDGVALDSFLIGSKPSLIILSDTSIEENQSKGTLIGILTTTDGDHSQHIYSLRGEQAEDFRIEGDELRADTVFNYELDSLFVLEVTSKDPTGLQITKSFNIKIKNIIEVNSPPTDIHLDSPTISENQLVGSLVGILTSDDVDDTYHRYHLTGEDTTHFFVSGDSLKTARIFDYEKENTINITLTSLDAENNSFSKEVSISITKDSYEIRSFPYAESFEEDNGGWQVDSGVWEWGIPNDRRINSASNGQKVWMTDLDDEYPLNPQSQILLTPFFDVSSLDNVALAFDLFYNIDGTGDAVKFAYRTSDDASLKILPVDSITDAKNWNKFTSYSFVTDGWNGTEDGYIRAEAGVDFFKGQTSIQFAFILSVTRSFDFNNYDGVAIDSFVVSARPTSIALSNTSILPNQSVGTEIGLLSTTDSDHSHHTYHLSGYYASYFLIAGDTLKNNRILGEERRTIYNIDVTTTDPLGFSYTQSLIINVVANERPTDIMLSGSSIVENAPIGTLLGAFTTVDADDATHTYALSGSDASGFIIRSDSLLSNVLFDYSEGSSYRLTITTTDLGGLSYSEDFEIEILEEVIANERPTDIMLSGSSIVENAPIGTLLGTFTTVDADDATHTYALSGSDASGFIIRSDSLLSNVLFDYSEGSSYRLTITTTDLGGLSYSEDFEIEILEEVIANERPTDIMLSGSSIVENAPIGTLLGTLTTVDADDATHTYALSGSDASGFIIRSDSLLSNVLFDYSEGSSYRLTITTTDLGGLSYSEGFEIEILEEVIANERPTDIMLSGSSIVENAPIGTLLGTFTTVDADDATHTYALSGSDASGFIIRSDSLLSNVLFDYSEGSSYRLTITTTDLGGLSYSEDFEIEILEEVIANERPTDIMLSGSSIVENAPIGTLLGTLTTVDADDATHTYALSGSDASGFIIRSDSLLSNVLFDYSEGSSYRLTITTTDLGGLSYSEDFEIEILEEVIANERPTDIMLSGSSIVENAPIGTLLGTLTTVDADDATHTYALSGSDASGFIIRSDSLLSNVVFDYETRRNYTLLISTEDPDGHIYKKVFTIMVLNSSGDDMSISPTDIRLTNNKILENSSIGTMVGLLETEDLDGGDHRYELSGANGDKFRLSHDTLYSAAVFDYESRKIYGVLIRTLDSQSNRFEKDFEIEILNDASDDVLGLEDLSFYGIRLYPNPYERRLRMEIKNDYYGEIEMKVYSISGEEIMILGHTTKEENQIDTEIAIEELPYGSYLLRIKMGDKVVTGKIIKK